MASDINSLKVVLRFRPSLYCDKFFSVEKNAVVYKSFQQMSNNQITQKCKSITFSEVLEPEDSQEKVYKTVCPSLVKSFFEGTSGLVFAYGLTNSGKTFSVEGTEEDRGIVPRLLEKILRGEKDTKPPNCYVAISFAEIYQEKIFDLFAEQDSKGNACQLKLKQHNHQTEIFRLKHIKVSCLRSAIKAYKSGCKKRHSSSTSFNSRSSRSHALFFIKLVPDSVPVDSNVLSTHSSICVADLAGSEKTSELQNENESAQHLFDESTKINKSLVVLGRVMSDVRWNQAHPENVPRVIPWRETTVTRLFQNYFLAGGKCIMLVSIWVTPETLNQTLRVLDYASIASSIKVEKKFSSGVQFDRNVYKNKNGDTNLSYGKLSQKQLLEKSLICSEVFTKIEEILPRVISDAVSEQQNKYEGMIEAMAAKNSERVVEERKVAWEAATKQIWKLRHKLSIEKKKRKNLIKEQTEKHQNRVEAEKFKNETFKNVISELEDKIVALKQEIAERDHRERLYLQPVVKSEQNNPVKPEFKAIKRKKYSGARPQESAGKRKAIKFRPAVGAPTEDVRGQEKGTEVCALTVVSLKEILRKLNLHVSGVKAELVERLEKAIRDGKKERREMIYRIMREKKRRKRERKVKV